MSEPTSALDVACPACNAKVGEPCMTEGGREAKAEHAPRIELFKLRREEVRKLNRWNAGCQETT